MAAVGNVGFDAIRAALSISARSGSEAAAGATMEGLFQARTDSAIVSELATNIGKAYERVKQTGDETAIRGFSAIVTSFGSELSGAGIVDVVTGVEQMGAEDLRTYGRLAAAIDELGSSATLAQWAGQAGRTFALDPELGRSYLGATGAILEAGYSGSHQEVVDQQLGNLSDFMEQWSRLDTAGQPDEATRRAYLDLADRIGSMTEGSDIAAAIADFPGAAGSSAAG